MTWDLEARDPIILEGCPQLGTDEGLDLRSSQGAGRGHEIPGVEPLPMPVKGPPRYGHPSFEYDIWYSRLYCSQLSSPPSRAIFT